MTGTTICLLAKVPIAGEVKTRLIPAVGADGAAQLAKQLLKHSVRQALAVSLHAVELCATHPEHNFWKAPEFSLPLKLVDQGEGDLGARMARAAERVTSSGGRVILMGADCPTLDAQAIKNLAVALDHSDAVIQPAVDGGYVALGLNHFDARLFADMRWSTSGVYRETQNRIAQLGWTLQEFPALRDIDLPEDLEHLPRGIADAALIADGTQPA